MALPSATPNGWYWDGRELQPQEMSPMNPLLANQGGFNYANLIAALQQSQPTAAVPTQDPTAPAAQPIAAQQAAPVATSSVSTGSMEPGGATPQGGGFKKGGRVGGTGGMNVFGALR